MSESIREVVDFLDTRLETPIRMRFEGIVDLSLLNYIEGSTSVVRGHIWSWSAVASPILDHIDREVYNL